MWQHRRQGQLHHWYHAVRRTWFPGQLCEGFIQGLAEEGIVEGENLTIEYVNAQADNGTSAMTASNFVSKKVDMICAIATPCAMAAYNATMNTIFP